MVMKYEKQHFHIGEEEIRSGVIQKVIEPLWFTVSIYDDYAKYNADLQKFSLPQRYIFAIQWYLAETYNGGHDQFFFNSTGIVWKDVLEGFGVIGLDECAEILSEAARRMGGSPSFDREERWEQQEEHNAEFDDLDKRLYSIDESSIYALMMDYILKNIESFYYDGDIEMPVYEQGNSDIFCFDV